MKMMCKSKYGLLLLSMMLTFSCSTDTEQIESAYQNIVFESEALTKQMLRLGFATFEGKWSLSGFEESGNLTVTKDSFEFVLPEKLLIQYILETATDVSKEENFFKNYIVEKYDLLPENNLQNDIIFAGTSHNTSYSLNGISEATGYMNFSNDGYNTYSFSVTFGEVPYIIDASFEVGYAMYDIIYGQWTLQFPLYRTKVTNLETGWNKYWVYEREMVLKFVTTKKIE